MNLALAGGVALVVGGLLWLGHNLGILPGGVPAGPFILMAAGAALLLAPRPKRSEAPAQHTAAVDKGTAASARIVLAHGAGRLVVHPGAPQGMLVTLASTTPVEQRVRTTGSHLDVELSPRVQGWPREGVRWELALADDVELEVVVRTGASEVRLDLADLHVGSLEVATGASDVDVTLPAHGRSRAAVHAGAADVRLRVPIGTAANVVNRSALASVRIDEGRFPRSALGFRSPGFDDAVDRVDIAVDGGVASFAVT